MLKENGVQMELEDLHESEVDVNDRLGTEEEMLNRSSDSKFRKEFEKVKQYNAEKCANDESRRTGSELNSLYEPELANNICKNLMPTAPLWSGLLLNDLSRHGDSKPYQDYKDKRIMGITSIKDRYRTFLNDNKTIGGSERRMGIMYELQMNSRSRIRLDDFFRTVHEDVIGLQRTFADQYRSSSTGRKRPKQTVTESWDKKRKGNPYSKKDVGYYQAAPPSRNPVSLKGLSSMAKVNADDKATSHKKEEHFQDVNIKGTKRRHVHDDTNLASSSKKMKVDDDADQNKNKVNDMKYKDIFDDEDITMDEHEFHKGREHERMFTVGDVVIHEYNVPLKRIYPGLYQMEQMKETVEVLQTVLRRLLIGLPNYHNNCWLNAVLQAMCSIIHSYKFLKLNLDFTIPSYPLACQSLFTHLRRFTAASTNLREKQVDCLRMLERLNSTDFRFGLQHDAHEIMGNIVNSVNAEPDVDIWQLSFGEMSTCFSCGKAEVMQRNLGVSVLVLEKEGLLGETHSIQSAIDNFFADEQIKDVKCECGGESGKGYAKVVTKAPTDLAIVLNRYNFNKEWNIQQKCRRSIYPSYILNLDHHSTNGKKGTGELFATTDVGKISTQYKLRACVLHHGDTTTSGHYTACTYVNENVLIQYDDMSAKVVSAGQLSSIQSDGYIFFYERLDQIDEFVERFAPAFLAAACIDNIPMAEGFTSKVPLDDFKDIRDRYLGGEMEKSAFHSLLLITAREYFQRVPLYNNNWDFDALFYDALKEVNTNYCRSTVSIEQRSCLSCGSEDAEMIVENELQITDLDFHKIERAFLRAKEKRKCKSCTESRTFKPILTFYDVPDTLVVKCRSISPTQEVKQTSLGKELKIYVNSSQAVKYRVHCIFSATSRKLFVRNGDQVITCDASETNLYSIAEYGAYIDGTRKQFGKGEYTIILVKVDRFSPANLENKRVKCRNDLEHARTLNDSESNGYFLPLPNEDVIITEGLLNTNVAVHGNSLKQVREGGNLKGDVIDGFMLLIANAANEELDKPILVVPSLQLRSYVRKGHSSEHFDRIKRQKTEIIDNQYQYAITAWSLDDIHWIGMVVDIHKGILTYIDSLGSRPVQSAIDSFCFYMNVFGVLIKGDPKQVKYLSIMSHSNNFVRQTDSVSCGMFVCMYLRFIILSRNRMPINVNVKSERMLIYNAIVKKKLELSTAMNELEMIEFLKQIPVTEDREYQHVDLESNDVVTITDLEANKQCLEEYQEIFERKYLNFTCRQIYDSVLSSRYVVSEEMQRLKEMCSNRSSPYLKPFATDIRYILQKNENVLTKRADQLRRCHVMKLTREDSILPELIEMELNNWIGCRGNAGIRKTGNCHKPVPVIENCCTTGSPRCRSILDFINSVLTPSCLVTLLAKRHKRSREEIEGYRPG